MAYEPGALEATLAAAAGGDPALAADLRAAYREGVARQVDLLGRARCDGNWNMAAMRLKGLAASFHSAELLELAEAALEAAPGEPTVVRRLKAYLQAFSGG
ncbi:Hpt domain-containing protein [Novosphingobium soli]|uniref:Hpt domain-containing protein n=1 Tax=Novosphingobium soli TaxID=574956 RepID=A0ABV6CX84_9SPHN